MGQNKWDSVRSVSYHEISGLATKSPTLTSKEEETQAGLRPAFVIFMRSSKLPS